MGKVMQSCSHAGLACHSSWQGFIPLSVQKLQPAPALALVLFVLF